MHMTSGLHPDGESIVRYAIIEVKYRDEYLKAHR